MQIRCASTTSKVKINVYSSIFDHFLPVLAFIFYSLDPDGSLNNNLPIWRIYLFHFLTFDKCGWDIYPDPQPHISAYAHHPSETVLLATAWPSLFWIYLKRDISKNIAYMYGFLGKILFVRFGNLWIPVVHDPPWYQKRFIVLCKFSARAIAFTPWGMTFHYDYQ